MAHLKQIFLAVTLLVMAELTLKYSLKGIVFSKDNIFQFFLTALTNPLTLAGFFILALSSIVWISTLSKTDLSYAYPFVSTGYVAITILSVILLNESPSITRWLGVLVIVFGIVLVSRS